MEPMVHGEADLSGALARLAFVEVETPEDFVARVLAAVESEDGRPAAVVRTVRRLPASTWRAAGRGAEGAAGWLARHDRLRWGALASSAVLLGALVIGLEARHLSRSRQERAA